MGNFLIRDIHGHTNPRLCSFALETRVYWSKNVSEERDCQDQILLGCFDVDYCILLALGVYLKTWLIAGSGRECHLLFSDEVGEEDVRGDVVRLKNRYMTSALTRSVFSNRLFISICRDARESSHLGSHSIRKYPATFARQNGCSVDEIDCRGRWKRNSHRVVDRYVDVGHHYIDGKVAAALCPGGPVKYVLVEGCGITRDWLMVNVVPGIASFYDDENDTLADVLALPVLWACFDGSYVTKLPPWLVDKVRGAYTLIRVLPADVNPVTKRKLVVYSVSGTLRIDELKENNNNNNNENNNNIHNNIHLANTVILQQLQQLLQQLSEEDTTIKFEVRETEKRINKNIKTISNNVTRFTNQPAHPIRLLTPGTMQEEEVVVGRVGGHEPLPENVSLSNSPRTLFDLWGEWTTGLGGRKAAKDFTSHDRGLVRFKYCRRKVFWDCVNKHVCAGYTAHACIDKIYLSYGIGLSVTSILNKMVQDKKDGGHYNLQI